MNARAAGVLVLACACGGADPSSLFDDAGAKLDATAPLDASPKPDAAPPHDAGPPDAVAAKDAEPPKDAGSPYQDPGVACGTTDCAPGSQLCCGTVTSYYPQYTYSFACESTSDLVQCAAGLPIYCDSDHDCDGGQVCCGDLNYQNYAKVSCKPTCTGNVYGYTQVHFCDPKAPDCDVNQTCKASVLLPGYYTCQ